MTHRDPDFELVRRTAAKPELSDPSLGERLRCVPAMLRAQNRRLGSPLNGDDLEEVVQDSCLVALRKLADFEPGSSFESWVYRICYLELMNAVRRKGRRPRIMEGTFGERPADQVPGRPAPSPWEFDELYRGLECLQPEEATIIRLKHFEGLTFDEIAARTGVPRGTAKTRHYRGMVKLQEFLEGRLGEPYGEASDG